MYTLPSYLQVDANSFKHHFFPSSYKWKVIFIDEMYPIHSRCDSDCNSHATCQSSFRNLGMEDIKLMYKS